MVFEALAILRENNADSLPVYEGGRFISDISEEALTDFLNHLDNGKNIYFYKLNFDLGTALIRIREQRSKPKKLTNVFIRVAVITFTILGLAWLFFANKPSQQPSSFKNKASHSLANNAILPGSNKATLTLSNGQTIHLSEEKTGVVINASDLKYNDNTTVISKEERDLLNSMEKLKVTTPRGGQYKVTLSDGTRVWLNAASSLKFPASFAGTAQRKVELTGEAYFEVTGNKTHPFIVVSNEQVVKVLGTHFNISSYDDEGSIKTTLSEGSLIVTSSRGKRSDEGSPGHAASRDISYRRDDVVLKPGQQSTFTGNNPIEVRQVDTNDAIAWKEGKFAFRNESLESIMRKVARWYAVEIVYQNNQICKEILGGSFTRSEQISSVLATLELAANVHFKIEGKKVIVTK